MSKNASNIAETLSRIETRLDGLGVTCLEPGGLISPSFPDTFSASGFHDHVRALALGNCDCSGSSVGTEWVFRHVDRPRVATSLWHLSMFRMMVVLFGTHLKHMRNPVHQSIGTLFDLLDICNLNRRSILVSVYAGGESDLCKQIEPNPDFDFSYRKCGLTSEQIIEIRGESLITNNSRPGEPAGPRSEVFIQIPTGEIVEVATVVQETHLLAIRKGEDPVRLQNPVTGFALGLERISSLSESAKCVDTEEIIEFTHRLRQNISQSTWVVLKESIRDAVDACRSLVGIAILCRGDVTGANRRRIIRRLVLGVASVCPNLGLTTQQFLAFAVEQFSREFDPYIDFALAESYLKLLIDQ